MSKIFLDKFAVSVAETIAKYTDSARERNQPYHADGQEFPEDQLEKDVKQVNALIKKPAFTLGDLDAYRDALKHINTSGIDDRLLLLEKLLILMSRLSDSRWKEQADKLQEFVIQTLYDDLPHPPSSYISSLDNQATVATAPKGVKYAFRSADGSNYNPLFPSLGKAGSPYARTVPAVHHVPKHVLPDPGLVFDTLLKRDKFEEHPGGISSLFFAFADLIIHCIFDTNHADWAINNTSSYLDLSILYGNSQADQDEVRRKDGSGKLWDDTFADPRLLLMPPATCALLVLLSRNHNYIAQKLLDINENGNLVYPYPKVHATCQKQDDEIFHRARLVNCGYFIKIILGDYVGSILGLVRDGSAWRLDPMLACRESNHQVSPRGEGNVCSVEFNLLYRWHATLSEKDTKWTTDLFSDLFKKDFGEVTINDFKEAAHRVLIPDADVKKREFGGLHRQADGRFKDSELAKIIQDATEWRAGAFKARGIPAAMRIIEVMGIEQARSWGTCSLNEFRKFLGLKPFESFKKWNDNEEIYTAAAALYKDIDNLELYVGLQAEKAKDPGPGAGLCPGYTISRAILSDAVALTRGDRYLTTEFTPANLTAWGYADCQYDPLDGSYGGMLTKLLFRHLPEYYPAGSAYAHFPFLEPAFMKKNLEQNDPSVVGKYDWNRPPVPTPFVPATTYAKVEEIVKNPSVFVSAYNTRLHVVTAPGLSHAKAPKAGITSDIDKLVSGRKKVERLLGPGKTKAWDQYFRDEIDSLLKDKSTSRVGSKDVKYVDIVGDVINLLPVHWISEEIIGLPLKTVTWQGGEWRQEHVYQRFADIGRYIFLNFDPDADYRLRKSALDTFEKVHKFGKGHLDATCSFFRTTVKDASAHKGIESHNCHDFVKQVKDAMPEATTSEVAAYIFSAVVPTAAHFSQAIAHVVDFYLDDDRKAEKEDIVKHSKTLDETASVEKVMGYVREALRINPTVRGFYRTTSQAAKLGTQDVPAGAKVFASVIDANQDKSAFGPDASLASFNRGAERSGILGIGEHGLLSAGFFEWVVPAILGEILGLKGLKRAPGISGKFSKFEEDWHGSKRQLYFDADGKITPFPASLIVQYEA